MIKAIAWMAAGLFLTVAAGSAQASPRLLKGHVPAEARLDRRLDRLDGAQVLHLSLGLAIPNQAALSAFLKDVYNPASPNYRHFLKRGEFANAYGPSQADYDAVIAFAHAHGLTVTAAYSSRMVLGVSGRVADVERAFSIHLFHFRRADKSVFYAPDSEPTVDDRLPLLHIGGLDNFVVVKPALKAVRREPNPGTTSGATGSRGRHAEGGAYPGYGGNDFRAAYAQNVALTGNGQNVALVELDSGYLPSDIQSYESIAGLPSVPLINRLVGGFDGSANSSQSGSLEVPLDIEMAVAMAPGLDAVIVYEGTSDTTDELLNQIAADDDAQQVSASWIYGDDATTDLIFQQMAAQGQSFFNASGDDGAYPVGEEPALVGNPYITVVGGTTLGTSGSGAWSTETTWYDSTYGSGGGVSGTYPIPSYQQNVSMAANHGSTQWRNDPDVAMVANGVFVYSQGDEWTAAGTSIATPLWASYLALVNQRAAQLGLAPVGAADNALYLVAQSPQYHQDFHDIDDGSTNDPNNPAYYSAVPGYDLATGWGSPAGQGLINDLLGLGRQSPTPTPVESATASPTMTPSPTISATFTASPTSTAVPTSTPIPTLVAATCGAGTTVNGTMSEPVWAGNYTQIGKLALGSNSAFQTALFKVRWDSTYLYVGFELSNCSYNVPPTSQPWQGEAFEVFLDMNNSPGTSYGPADFQYIVGYGLTQPWEQNGRTTGVLCANYQLPEEGAYTAELAIPWTTLGVTPSANAVYGFDIAADLDQSHGTRTGQLVWAGTAQDYDNTTDFGVLQLGPACSSTTPTATPTFSATASDTISATFSNSPSFSASPSFTVSPTVTASPTISPTFSASPTFSPSPTALAGCAYYNQEPAIQVVGQAAFNTGTSGSAANNLDYPEDLYTDGNILLVSDTHNNRVLLYNHLPLAPGASADVVIGQQGFNQTSANQGASSAAANTLSGPRGLYWDGSKLYIADTQNSRVLIFDGLPTANNAGASLVIGQTNFTSSQPAAGQASGLFYPTDVKGDGTRLFIADQTNNRVLVYSGVPTANGASANLVIGQADFTGASPNQGAGQPQNDTLYFPNALACAGGKLFISDEDNSRVLIYNSVPSVNSAAANVVVGQPNFSAMGVHCGADSLGGTPEGVYSDGTRLFVASSAQRVLVYNNIPGANGTWADEALGQVNPSFCGSNGAGPSSTNLWPFGLSGVPGGGDLFVADAGQNRVLEFGCQTMGGQPSATPSAALSASPSPTRTSTQTPTSSPSPSPSSTRTWSPTATATGTNSATPTSSPTLTRTPSPAPSGTSSPVQSATASPSRTTTPAASPTPSRTSSPIPSATASPTRTATPSASPTPSRTSSPIPSATASPSRTATPSASPTPSRTSSPALSATATPSRTATPSASPTPSRTSSPVPSATATATPASQQTPCAAPVLVNGSNQSWGDPGSDNSFNQAYAAGSGSDTALVVRTYMQSGVTIASVTYAGTALTEAAGAYVAYNGYVMQTWWMASPPASSNALVVNFPGTDYPNLTVFAATYSGVNQSTPIGAVANAGATACATSYQSSLTTQGSDSLIDDFLTLSSGGTVGATVSPGAGQTWEELNIAGGSAPAAFDDTLAAGSAGAYNLTYTFSYCLSDRFSQTIEIQGAPCGGPNVRPAVVAGGKLPSPSPVQSFPQTTLLVCPNPAAGSWTSVDYSVGQVCRGSLEVFSLLGRLVESKDLGTLQAGPGSATLDLAGYPAGIYFVALLEDGKPVGTFKLAVVR